MANVTFDIMWREAMMELLDQLEAENPEDHALAPKDLAEWSCIYIRYLQIFRKLEMAYDQITHPQKRIDMKKALEACMGRLLEVRHWLIKLNKGLDYINLDEILVDLKLTPEELEVPVPRYFVEDRALEVEDRAKFLEALIEKYEVKKPDPPGGFPRLQPLPEADAIAMIQVNERGRQARQRAAAMLTIKKQRQLEDKRTKLGIALTQEEAVTRIQSALRGHIWRKKIQWEAEREMRFIGLKPKKPNKQHDPAAQEGKMLSHRKLVQAENMREYNQAIVTLKEKVKDTEGQDMRETIQDKINAWFVENRHPETGEYPDFPEPDEGGSKVILNPPPPEPEPEEAEDAKGGKGKDAKGKDAKGKDAKKGKKGEEDDEAEEQEVEAITTVFVPEIEDAVQEYVAKWQDRDESHNFFQKYDAELVKDDLRPIVFEEIRKQVDAEMSVLLENLKDMVEAERAAKAGKKAKKKKKKKKKGKKGKKEKKGKKKDPTESRSMESLFAELVSTGILQQVPEVNISNYLGAFNYLGATLERAGILPDPSMAQVRQNLTEFAILPLGAQSVHEKAPFLKALLLYGPPQTGKTLLAQAVAHQTGANFFNLSPRNTDKQYPGKSVSLMLHMVFKVARTMAPSVIYIDECEKVLLTDKKKLKEFGPGEPFNRIRKDLLKEMKALKPGDRVLVMGSSNEPQMCVKKDKKQFVGFWDKHLYIPIPDYASRRLLWPGIIKKHGGILKDDFDISTLAQISENYTSGSIDQVVQSILTKRRLDRMKREPITIEEILSWLCKAQPTSKEVDQALRKWMDELPARAALSAGTTGKAAPAGGKDDSKKKGKKGTKK